jgi:pimeloyl-ACP methyl ester carboxylesterase
MILIRGAEPEIASASGPRRPLHFGLAERPLFGFYHPPRPAVNRHQGVVLCSPLGTDQTRSDRTYRHLAEALAAAGFACLRFDPFGTGDSGGDEHTPGLVRGWIDDIGVAIAEVKVRARVDRVSLVGLRLGATLATIHAAASGDVDSLVLWNPCVSAAAFVKEVTKLHKVYARIEPQLADARAPADDGVEALGTFLPRALVDDLSRLDLLETARSPARRALVIDGGGVAGRDALVAHLREMGTPCELRLHPGHKFLLTVSHRSLVPVDVIQSITSWLSEGPPGAPHSGTSPMTTTLPAAPTPPPANEQLRVFGTAHPLFGIFTPADAQYRDPARPPVVISNAGCVNRCGPHRLSTKMARRWASVGFDVLRVDLSGIGDSPPAPGVEENVTYPPSGMDDLGQAIQALGSDRVILAGLCSGGDYAFQLGAHEPRVAGALLMSPRTFCVLDLAAVESADGAPPTTPVSDVPRMLETMARRGVDTFLVAGRGDPGVAYVDAHEGAAMRALTSRPGFRRIDVDHTDHTFTPITAQEYLVDLLTEHLLLQFAPERGAGEVRWSTRSPP